MTSRRVLDYELRVKSAITTLEHLLAPSAGKGSLSVLAEIARRAEQPFVVDGFRAAGGWDPTGVGGTNRELTPVEAAVNQRWEDVCSRCEGSGRAKTGRGKCRPCNGTGKRWADPIGDAAHELMSELMKISHSADVVSDKVDAVLGSATRELGRRSSLQGTCSVPACGAVVSGVGSDRLKEGFCNRCYLRWCSWRLLHRITDPGGDRLAFTRDMAGWLAAKAKAEQERTEERRQDAALVGRRGRW